MFCTINLSHVIWIALQEQRLQMLKDFKIQDPCTDIRKEMWWRTCHDRHTWILAGPQGINSASFLSLIRWRDLWTLDTKKDYSNQIIQKSQLKLPLYYPIWNVWLSCWTFGNIQYLCWIHFSLNNVQNRNVTMTIFSVSQGWNHDIFGLQKKRKKAEGENFCIHYMRANFC